jgi:hypothetical protein
VLDARVVPDPLRLSRRLVCAAEGPDAVVVTTYSSFDPTRISQQLLVALREFDGRRSNAEALAAVDRTHGLLLSSGLLLSLYRQRILVTDQP